MEHGRGLLLAGAGHVGVSGLTARPSNRRSKVPDHTCDWNSQIVEIACFQKVLRQLPFPAILFGREVSISPLTYRTVVSGLRLGFA